MNLHVTYLTSLYGVDDLALWPFAVKHATWLYNWISSRTTGLTPVKRLTKASADH